MTIEKYAAVAAAIKVADHDAVFHLLYSEPEYRPVCVDLYNLMQERVRPGITHEELTYCIEGFMYLYRTLLLTMASGFIAFNVPPPELI